MKEIFKKFLSGISDKEHSVDCVSIEVVNCSLSKSCWIRVIKRLVNDLIERLQVA